MLLERKTLYDTRVHSRNIPQRRKIHLCTTREIEEKELCRFSYALRGKSGRELKMLILKPRDMNIGNMLKWDYLFLIW